MEAAVKLFYIRLLKKLLKNKSDDVFDMEFHELDRNTKIEDLDLFKVRSSVFYREGRIKTISEKEKEYEDFIAQPIP